MIFPHASFIITVNFHHQNEQIIALLEQLVAQNDALTKKVASLHAKVELLEHKFDTIAEEAGLI